MAYERKIKDYIPVPFEASISSVPSEDFGRDLEACVVSFSRSYWSNYRADYLAASEGSLAEDPSYWLLRMGRAMFLSTLKTFIMAHGPFGVYALGDDYIESTVNEMKTSMDPHAPLSLSVVRELMKGGLSDLPPHLRKMMKEQLRREVAELRRLQEKKDDEDSG